MPSLRPLAIVFAPLLVLAACSSDDSDDSDDSSADARPYVDAMVERFSSEDAGLSLDEASKQCVAEAMVAALDAGRLEGAGVTPEDLAEVQRFQELDVELDDAQLRDDLAESLDDCSMGSPVADALLAAFPTELSDEQRTCVADSLDANAGLSVALARTLVDAEENGFEAAFTEAMADCPSVMGDLLAASISSIGVEVDDEARSCFAAEMEKRGEAGVEEVLTGGAGAEALGIELAEACVPEAAAGLVGREAG